MSERCSKVHGRRKAKGSVTYNVLDFIDSNGSMASTVSWGICEGTASPTA